jgi:hypothetical protein
MAGGGCSPEQGIRERAARAGWPGGGGKKFLTRETDEWEEWKKGEGRKLSGRRGKRGNREREYAGLGVEELPRERRGEKEVGEEKWGEKEERELGGGGGGGAGQLGHASLPIPNVVSIMHITFW